MLSQIAGKLELSTETLRSANKPKFQNFDARPLLVLFSGFHYTYPCGMFIGLESQVKHLAGLITFLIHELVANSEQPREAILNNGVELCSVLIVVGLVSESTAYSKQTLKTSKN